MAKSQRFRKLRKSSKTWDAPVLPAIFGLLGGVLATLAMVELEQTARSVTAFAHEDSLAPVWAFLFGFVALGVPVLMVQKATERIILELRAVVNIRPFTGELLVGTDAWAMDAVFAENVVQVLNHGPKHVVELGSGHSSVLIARRLAHAGRGHLTSLDHLQEFADRTRGWIEEQGLSDVATVVHAPIENHQIDGATYPWYSMDVLEGRLPDRIDALIVDGPPGRIGKDARWPALPLLKDRLAPGALILMDDGDRGEETRVAYAWHRALGGDIRYLPGGKGGWLLRAPD